MSESKARQQAISACLRSLDRLRTSIQLAENLLDEDTQTVLETTNFCTEVLKLLRKYPGVPTSFSLPFYVTASLFAVADFDKLKILTDTVEQFINLAVHETEKEKKHGAYH